MARLINNYTKNRRRMKKIREEMAMARVKRVLQVIQKLFGNMEKEHEILLASLGRYLYMVATQINHSQLRLPPEIRLPFLTMLSVCNSH